MKLLPLAVASSLSLSAAIAAACGAPILTTAGAQGTAIFENKMQLSYFKATKDSVSWFRLDRHDGTTQLVATIDGALEANIETSPEVDTAISAQDGFVVQVSSDAVKPIEASGGASTLIHSSQFASALDEHGQWHLLAYATSQGTMSLYHETAFGTFTLDADVQMDCTASMITLVRETSGRFVGVCDETALLWTAAGGLQTVELPLASTLRLDDEGAAIFVGVQQNDDHTSSIERLRVGADNLVTVEDTVHVDMITYALPVDNHHMVAIDALANRASFVSLADGQWTASPAVQLDAPFLSAQSEPLRVMSGAYELFVDELSADTVEWKRTSLGDIGVRPVYAPNKGYFCSAMSADAGAPLVALGLVFALARLRRARPGS